MSSLECKICSGRLPDYVDGKLDPRDAALLREHLSHSPGCAADERAYRMLFQQALRRESSAGIPDPGSFLVRINAGIDSSTGGFTAIRRRVLRPGVLAPVLSAAVILVIAGVFFFHPAADQGAGDSLFSGLINESDLTELTEISPSSAVLDDVTISDLSLDREYLAEDGPAMRDPASLSAEIDLTLLEDVPYSAVVSASLEYISPDDVLENLSDTEADRIVTTLEQQPIRLL